MIDEVKIRSGYNYFLKLVEAKKLDIPYFKEWLAYLSPIIPKEKEVTRTVEEMQSKIKAMLERSRQEVKTDIKVEDMAHEDVEDLFR